MFKVVKVQQEQIIKPVNAKEFVVTNTLPDNITYNLRNNIRDYREKLGLTQKDVSEMLQITRQSLALIEKGDQSPSIITCWLISKVLRVPMEDLFYIEEMEVSNNEGVK